MSFLSLGSMGSFDLSSRFLKEFGGGGSFDLLSFEDFGYFIGCPLYVREECFSSLIFPILDPRFLCFLKSSFYVF